MKTTRNTATPKVSKKPLPVSEIFGVVDDALDRLEKTRRPIKKTVRRILPKMTIRDSEIPENLHKMDVGNVVYVPTSALRSLAAALNVETRSMNRLLLRKLIPLLLAYQTSTSYVQAAVKEGLNVEITFDEGLQECVKHIGYLNIIMHFIKRSTLPISIKRHFVKTFSERLAEQAVTSMSEVNKAVDKRAIQDQMQAVLYSRHKNKTEVKSVEEANTKPAKEQARPAVRKFRA